MAGTLLAVGLSAGVWLPFLAESRYVGIGLGPSEGYRQHLAPLDQLIQALPFYQYRLTHGAGAAEHPLSWPPVALMILVLAAIIWRWTARQSTRGLGIAAYGGALAVAAALMTADVSLPIWRPLQGLLAQLQYPWRFMTLVALGVTIAAGAVVLSPAAKRQPLRRFAWPGIVVLLALAFVVHGLGRIPAQPLPLTGAEAWGVARMWADDAAAGQVGATWTGEFLPQTVKEQRWALGRPLEGAADGPALSPAPRVQLASIGYDRIDLRFEANAPAQVRLHQFHLPMWRALVDGERKSTYPSGELGLVTVDIPAGAEQIAFRFGPSRATIAAGLIVTLAAVAWATLAWSNRWLSRRRDRIGFTIVVPVLLGLVFALMANGVGLGVRTWTPTPVESAVGDLAQLIAYDAAPARGEPALDVTLYWFVLRETSRNDKAFVHLLGPDGQVQAQHDGDPVGGYTPTTRWKQGELVADTHRLPLPEGIAPGEYTLRAGMYEIRPGETPGFANLPTTPATEDARVHLGVVRVE
jgi:hypothetical protein